MPPVDSRLVGGPTLDEFARRCADLGVEVGAVADSDAGSAWVVGVVTGLDRAAGLVTDELRERAPSLLRGLAAGGASWQVPSEPGDARDAQLGMSLAHLAVAETGSLLLAERTLADRAVGMLPRNHIVVCPSDRLVASLADSAAALRAAAGQPGGMATLVSGPSRTADIERVLTVGVQGPGRLFVLFVDDLT